MIIRAGRQTNLGLIYLIHIQEEHLQTTSVQCKCCTDDYLAQSSLLHIWIIKITITAYLKQEAIKISSKQTSITLVNIYIPPSSYPLFYPMNIKQTLQQRNRHIIDPLLSEDSRLAHILFYC